MKMTYTVFVRGEVAVAAANHLFNIGGTTYSTNHRLVRSNNGCVLSKHIELF